ncbi:MAG: hypothetical protein V1889_01935 [archaeon]
MKKLITATLIVATLAATLLIQGCSSSAGEIELFVFRMKNGTTSAIKGNGTSSDTTSRSDSW